MWRGSLSSLRARISTAFVSVELMRRKYREFPALAKAIYSISANIQRIDIGSELRFPDLEHSGCEWKERARGVKGVYMLKNIFFYRARILDWIIDACQTHIIAYLLRSNALPMRLLKFKAKISRQTTIHNEKENILVRLVKRKRAREKETPCDVTISVSLCENFSENEKERKKTMTFMVLLLSIP